MTADALRDLIARGVARHEADRVVARLRTLTRDRLYALLNEARVPLVRMTDIRGWLESWVTDAIGFAREEPEQLKEFN